MLWCTHVTPTICHSFCVFFFSFPSLFLPQSNSNQPIQSVNQSLCHCQFQFYYYVLVLVNVPTNAPSPHFTPSFLSLPAYICHPIHHPFIPYHSIHSIPYSCPYYIHQQHSSICHSHGIPINSIDHELSIVCMIDSNQKASMMYHLLLYINIINCNSIPFVIPFPARSLHMAI